MHLTPGEDFQPGADAGGSTGATGDPHATQPWPRAVSPRRPGGPDSSATRLALSALADVAEPTRPLRQVTPTADRPADVVNQILDHQQQLNARHADRLDALAGVRRRPTVHEAAAARHTEAAREARRHTAHLRHIDVLEMVRAYLTILALVLLVLLVGAAALLALGILAGQYTWMPVKHS